MTLRERKRHLWNDRATYAVQASSAGSQTPPSSCGKQRGMCASGTVKQGVVRPPSWHSSRLEMDALQQGLRSVPMENALRARPEITMEGPSSAVVKRDCEGLPCLDTLLTSTPDPNKLTIWDPTPLGRQWPPGPRRSEPPRRSNPLDISTRPKSGIFDMKITIVARFGTNIARQHAQPNVGNPKVEVPVAQRSLAPHHLISSRVGSARRPSNRGHQDGARAAMTTTPWRPSCRPPCREICSKNAKLRSASTPHPKRKCLDGQSTTRDSSRFGSPSEQELSTLRALTTTFLAKRPTLEAPARDLQCGPPRQKRSIL